MENLQIFTIEWNDINGLDISLLRINSRALFGFCYGRFSFIQIDLLFFRYLKLFNEDIDFKGL